MWLAIGNLRLVIPLTLESPYILGSLGPSFCLRLGVSYAINGLKFVIPLGKRSTNAVGGPEPENYIALLICPGLRDNAPTFRSCMFLLVCLVSKDDTLD